MKFPYALDNASAFSNVHIPFLLRLSSLAYHVETHRLNLRSSQHDLLERMLAMCCRLYNAALEERIGNWRHGKMLASMRGLASPQDLPDKVWSPVTLHTQFAALTKVRADDPDGYGAIPTNVAREVLVRLDRAMKRFFDRAATGKGKAGFPRYRSVRRWSSFAWNEMNGVRTDGDHLRFHAFGQDRTLRFLRHRAWPKGARPCSVRLVRKTSRWEMHVQVEYPLAGEVVKEKPRPVDHFVADRIEDVELKKLWLSEARAVERRRVKRLHDAALVLDEELRKTEFLAALDRDEVRAWDANIVNHLTNDRGEAFANPRLGRRHRALRSRTEREVARSKRGSKRGAQAKRRLKRLREREGNARRTLAHQQSRRIVRESRYNVFEGLRLVGMTASARGTVEEPGMNVAAKAALNREMLDCAHGMRLDYVRYKAERAGGWTVTVPPHGTSITCSECGGKDKAGKDRIFRCGSCGMTLDRDVNAARNALQRSRGVVAPCEVASRPLRGKPREKRVLVRQNAQISN